MNDRAEMPGNARPPSSTAHARARLERLAAIPGGPSVVLRVFLGFTFVYAGLQKLANPAFFTASAAGSFQSQLRGAAISSPIAPLLHVVNHAAVPVAVVISIGEVAVGLGTLLGLCARLAAVGGMALSLSFFLTISYATSPYYYGSDIVFFFAWTTIVLGGAGPLSLDAVLARRIDNGASPTEVPNGAGTIVDRRFALSRLGAVGGTTALIAALAGGAAGIGRALGPKAVAGTVPPTGNPSPDSPTSTTVAPHVNDPAGQVIGKASALPVGGALGFTDPIAHLPAFAVQPSAGNFVAFSAVCTHAGCLVSFDPGSEHFVCPCHGSVYDARTGAVLQGPATAPLPALQISRSATGELTVES